MSRIIPVLSVVLVCVYFTLTAQAQTQMKAGDRVTAQMSGFGAPDDFVKATVKEVGSDSRNNCLLILVDNDPTSAKNDGYWVCHFGLTGKVFLLDKSGNRGRDINAPVPAGEKVENDDNSANSNAENDTQNKSGSSGKFKIGDRVEVVSGGKWFPGTVTRGLDHNAYKVAMDKFIGQGLPDWQATPDMIRALNDGSEAPAEPEFPLMRKAAKCPDQPAVKNGAAPQLALLKKLIQCSWEELSTERSIINFDIKTAQIGKPLPWRESWAGRDMGTGVPGETLVYPVSATWTKKTFAADGSSVTIAEEKGVQNCYVNSSHKWQCGNAETRETKPLQTIYKKKDY